MPITCRGAPGINLGTRDEGNDEEQNDGVLLLLPRFDWSNLEPCAFQRLPSQSRDLMSSSALVSYKEAQQVARILSSII